MRSIIIQILEKMNKIQSAFLVIVFAAIVNSCQTADKQSSYLYKQVENKESLGSSGNDVLKKRFNDALIAAKNGNREEQFKLGGMYVNGTGTKEDHQEAYTWFLKASQQGHINAQAMLGVMYYVGSGTKKDHQEGYSWLLKAAQQGHTKSQVLLAGVYFAGSGVKQNHQEGRNWLLKAAKLGNKDALLLLGGMYESGRYVKQNKIAAKEWYVKACVAGINIGCDHYKKLIEEGY